MKTLAEWICFFAGVGVFLVQLYIAYIIYCWMCPTVGWVMALGIICLTEFLGIVRIILMKAAD